MTDNQNPFYPEKTGKAKNNVPLLVALFSQGAPLSMRYTKLFSIQFFAQPPCPGGTPAEGLYMEWILMINGMGAEQREDIPEVVDLDDMPNWQTRCLLEHEGEYLDGLHGGGLEAQVSLELLRNLTHQPLEGEAANQQGSGLLEPTDLPQRYGTRAEAVTILDPSGGGHGLPGRLAAKPGTGRHPANGRGRGRLPGPPRRRRRSHSGPSRRRGDRGAFPCPEKGTGLAILPQGE